MLYVKWYQPENGNYKKDKFEQNALFQDLCLCCLLFLPNGFFLFTPKGEKNKRKAVGTQTKKDWRNKKTSTESRFFTSTLNRHRKSTKKPFFCATINM